MTIKAVIFDMDGTLLDTLGDLADASNWALRELGFPTHPEDAYRQFVGDGARMLCVRMLPEACRDEETVSRLRAVYDARYRAHLFDRTRPYAGIAELLEQLKQDGLLLGIVSNKPDAFVQAIAERYFPAIFDGVTGPQGALVKPDPSGVKLLLGRFGIEPAEALYVGDSGVDIQTAQNANTHSCGAVWGFRGEQELRENGAEFLARVPSEVLECVGILKGLVP